MLVEEARDLAERFLGLRGIRVEIILRVRHALEHLQLGLHAGAAQLAVGQNGEAEKHPPCTWTSRRLRFSGAISFGVTMNALTPPTTVGSRVTPSFSRIPICAAALAAARRLINSFHSAALLGLAFQFGTRYGAAIDACNCGLAVAGTGMARPGTVRGPAFALAAFCAASSVAKSPLVLRVPAASCATAGRVRATTMTGTSRM